MFPIAQVGKDDIDKAVRKIMTATEDLVCLVYAENIQRAFEKATQDQGDVNVVDCSKVIDNLPRMDGPLGKILNRLSREMIGTACATNPKVTRTTFHIMLRRIRNKCKISMVGLLPTPAPTFLETTQPATTFLDTTQPATTFFETTQPATTFVDTTQPITTFFDTTQPATTFFETTQTTQPVTTFFETTQTIQPETTVFDKWNTTSPVNPNTVVQVTMGTTMGATTSVATTTPASTIALASTPSAPAATFTLETAALPAADSSLSSQLAQLQQERGRDLVFDASQDTSQDTPQDTSEDTPQDTPQDTESFLDSLDAIERVLIAGAVVVCIEAALVASWFV